LLRLGPRRMIVVLAAPFAGPGRRIVAVRQGDALARDVAFFGTDQAAAVSYFDFGIFLGLKIGHGGLLFDRSTTGSASHRFTLWKRQEQCHPRQPAAGLFSPEDNATPSEGLGRKFQTQGGAPTA